MLAESSSNHRQRSRRNLVDGHAIPGSGLLLATWQTGSGACSDWIGIYMLFNTRRIVKEYTDG